MGFFYGRDVCWWACTACTGVVCVGGLVQLVRAWCVLVGVGGRVRACTCVRGRRQACTCLYVRVRVGGLVQA